MSTYFRSSCSYGIWRFCFTPLLSSSIPQLNSVKLQLWSCLNDAFKKDQRSQMTVPLNNLWYSWKVYFIFLCFLFYICFFFDFFFTTPIFPSLCMSVFFRTLVGVSASTVAHSSSLERRQSLGIDTALHFLLDCSTLKSNLTEFVYANIYMIQLYFQFWTNDSDQVSFSFHSLKSF